MTLNPIFNNIMAMNGKMNNRIKDEKTQKVIEKTQSRKITQNKKRIS